MRAIECTDRSRRLRAPFGIGLVLLGSLLAACGGGGSTPSKADFVRSADAVCGPTSAAINSLPPLPDNPSPSQITGLVQRTLQIIEPAITKLKALPGSSGDKAVLNQNLIAPTAKEDAAARTFLTEIGAAGNDPNKQQAAFQKLQAATTDPQQQAHDAALSAYGFSACAKTNT